MPVRADIYSQAPSPRFENKPFGGLDRLVKMQENQQVLQQQRLKTEAMQRAADEELAFNQIVSQGEGDWEHTYAALLRSAPSLAPKYMESVQREREVRFKAMQEETAAELAEAQRGLRSLDIAIQDPSLWPVIGPGLASAVPDLAPVIDKLDPANPQFVDQLKTLRSWGLSAKEQTEREDKWNQAFLKGDFRYAGEVLSQADNPQEAAQILHEAGMPTAAVQAMLADPSAWRMTAEERSQEENRGARLKEEERQNRAQIATQIRGQDVSASTTRRGQDISAQVQREGQRLSEAVETVLVDGKPTIVRRSQAVGQQPAPSPTKADKDGPNVAAIMDQIDTLSQKINTEGGGPGANISAIVRKGRAMFNLDNDVAEYEALIKGMIPMVARAVGHTGVLTQQDVDSVRNLFPRVGDNATLAKNKMARVKQLIGSVQPSTTPATPDAASGRVGPYTYRVRPR